MTTEGQEPTKELEATKTDVTPATDDKTFPLDYVQQLRQEAASYRTKLKEFETAQAAQQDADLAKRNEWQELAEQRAARIEKLEATEAAYTAMLETIKASNTKRIEAIPEERRTLVPEYDDPTKLAAWLDANAAIVTGILQAPNLNGGAGSKQTGSQLPALSDAEIQVAKNMGLTPEQYQQSKAKMKVR